MIKNSTRRNKTIIWALVIFFVTIWILYALFSRPVIKAMYEGRTIEILNRIIEGQTGYGLGYYFNKADWLFFEINIAFLAILFMCSALVKTNKKAVIKYILLFIIFSIGIILGYFLWDRIRLPFQNPWGIKGLLTSIKYNPANDIVRFAVLLLCPIFILFGIYLLNIKRFNNICFGHYNSLEDSGSGLYNIPPIWKKMFVIIAVIFSIFIAINTPTYHSSWGFDPFHEGEPLGTSISYLSGKLPYKDIFLNHGIYQDPLRAVIAYNLFGRSIGSVRTLESIIKVSAFILLAIFVFKIHRKNYLYSFLNLTALGFLFKINHFYIPQAFHVPQLMIIPSRDITTFTFLICIPLLHNFIISNDNRINTKKFFVIVFLFSFVPLASFAYSIDRGLYLFVSFLIISPLLYYFHFRNKGLKNYYLIASFLGLLSAILLLGILLRGRFFEFFKIVFYVIPRAHGLREDLVFPIHKVKFFMCCVFLTANAYFISFKFIKEFDMNNKELTVSIRKFLDKYLIEFSLVILSIFMFKTALGRSDWEHIPPSISLTYILLTYIIVKNFLHRALCKYNLGKVSVSLISFMLIFISAAGIYRIHNASAFAENFPLRVKDSEFIPDNYKATISFLKNNLSEEEEFFTMTSEASWYYFVDKACPARFPIVWLAGPPFYQKEIVDGLKRQNVKFILYKDGSSKNAIDGFDNEVRLPIVFDYIKQNYVFFKKIGDEEIWIRKQRK